jgi:hypothetical protein
MFRAPVRRAHHLGAGSFSAEKACSRLTTNTSSCCRSPGCTSYSSHSSLTMRRTAAACGQGRRACRVRHELRKAAAWYLVAALHAELHRCHHPLERNGRRAPLGPPLARFRHVHCGQPGPVVSTGAEPVGGRGRRRLHSLDGERECAGACRAWSSARTSAFRQTCSLRQMRCALRSPAR